LDNLSTGALLGALVALLALSAFFSMAETSMMALNRYRLRHLAAGGSRGAQLTQALLERTDLLLGVILLGNNLINASAATLTTIITLRLFGEGEWALSLATLLLTFAILVFSEVTPKVIGAAYPERIALPSSYILSPLLRLLSPVVWFVNLFVQAILRLLRLQSPASGPQPLTQEELRTLVLEAGRYIPAKHQSMLLSLLELESTMVDDIMVPRQQIESIDLEADDDELRHQLATCHHNRVLVCRGSADDVVGLLHVRRILHLWESGEFSREALETQVRPPVFVPSGSNLLSQLQSLQEQRERLALVIDEYGEILGLLALEDVLEEIVGEFTTQSPHRTTAWAEDSDGGWVIDGSAPLRDLNRKLGLHLSLEGPRTLNGLILEHLQDLPEAGVSLKLEGVTLEILSVQDRAVRSVRLRRVEPAETGPAGD
jgi:Mg2+/Co2+ transporter CorB